MAVHIIIFAYILIFSSGFAALAALVYLRYVTESRLLSSLLGVHATFLLSIGTLLQYYYIKQIAHLLDAAVLSPDLFFSVFSSFLNVLLLVWVCDLLRKLQLETVHLIKLRMSVYFGSLTTIMLIVFKTAGAAAGSALLMSSPILSGVTYVLITLIVGGFGLILLMHEHTPRFASLFRPLGICALGFIPLSIAEYLLATSGNNFYSPLSLDTIFFLAISIVIIIYTFRYITSGNKVTDEDKLSSFCNDFGVTGRQREMLSLIEEGKANKEIAYELGISDATVRTHIYNLYKKTGVQSRTELIHLLHTYDNVRS
jgi:DNA-binding CsgD family transcriptional regulator